MSCDTDCLLARCRIHDEQSFLRLQKFFQLFEFLNERLVDFLPACRVEDVNGGASSSEPRRGSGSVRDVAGTLPSRLCQRCRCGALNVFLAWIGSENRHVNLFPERYELLDRCRTLQIAR